MVKKEYLITFIETSRNTFIGRIQEGRWLRAECRSRARQTQSLSRWGGPL